MKKIIRLSNLLFSKYPNSANDLRNILNKHNISFEIIENTKDTIEIQKTIRPIYNFKAKN